MCYIRGCVQKEIWISDLELRIQSIIETLNLGVLNILVRTCMHRSEYGLERACFFVPPTTWYFVHGGYQIDDCLAISRRKRSLLTFFNAQGQAIPFLFLFFLFFNIYLAAPGLSCTTEHLWSCGMWGLVPWPEVKPGPPALGEWHPLDLRWTIREVLGHSISWWADCNVRIIRKVNEVQSLIYWILGEHQPCGFVNYALFFMNLTSSLLSGVLLSTSQMKGLRFTDYWCFWISSRSWPTWNVIPVVLTMKGS